MSSLKIAMAQINPILGDLEANIGLIAAAAREAWLAGADVVLTPEQPTPVPTPDSPVSLPLVIAGIVGAVLAGAMGSDGQVLNGLFSLATFLPSLSVQVRRLLPD